MTVFTSCFLKIQAMECPYLHLYSTEVLWTQSKNDYEILHLFKDLIISYSINMIDIVSAGIL